MKRAGISVGGRVKILSLLVLGLLGAVATFGTPSEAALIGNILNARSAAGDGALGVFYSNYVPMPGTGVVDAIGLYYQASPYAPFNAYQLRPTGNPNEYTVVYDSGAITPSGTPNTALRIPLPNGKTYVRPGDIFAHYGRGIPYSDSPGGINITNARMIYYPSPAAPTTGSTITLPSVAFPSSSYIRDYASAVNWEWYVGNELTPRTNPSDGAPGVFYTNFVPMPVHGIADSVGIYFQGNPNNYSFNLYQLRPTGTANQYQVIYDSGAITPSGASNTILNLLFPNGPTVVLPGDIFAHYGRGIPYSSSGQLNYLNPYAIYYPSPSAPLAGQVITLGSAAFPLSGYIRDYSFAVHLFVPEPQAIGLLATGLLLLGVWRPWGRKVSPPAK